MAGVNYTAKKSTKVFLQESTYTTKVIDSKIINKRISRGNTCGIFI